MIYDFTICTILSLLIKNLIQAEFNSIFGINVFGGLRLFKQPDLKSILGFSKSPQISWPFRFLKSDNFIHSGKFFL